MGFFIGVVVVVCDLVPRFVQFEEEGIRCASRCGLSGRLVQKSGMRRDDAMFSTYTEARLVRNSGATLIVGSGCRNGSDAVGSVIEVLLGRGVVTGELIVPSGIASWHRRAADESLRSGKPTADVLLEYARRYRDEHGGERT